MVFSSSYDYFADLKGIGVETDAYDRPDRAAAEEAWHRLGARFLATRDPREQRAPWALQQFGEPNHAR